MRDDDDIALDRTSTIAPCARRLSLLIWPSPEKVRTALLRIETALHDGGVAVGPAGLGTLVLAEVLNNIAEHGHANVAPAWVMIDLSIAPGRVSARVVDRGAPMPGLTLPAGDPPHLDVARADLPEGGFGWHLIRRLTSRLHYARASGANRLTLEFDMAALGGIEG